MSFKQKWILVQTFVHLQSEVMYVYEFQTKANSHEGICCVSVWSYLSWRALNKGEFLSTYFLSLSLKLCTFMSFKPKSILMRTFFNSQFNILQVFELQTKVNSRQYIGWLSFWTYVFYEFQTKASSSEDVSWLSVWCYVSLWVSNRSQFLSINLLSLSLKLCNFMSFKQKRILMKAFVDFQLEVM